MPHQDHDPLLVHDGARWRTVTDKSEPFVRLPGGSLVRPSRVTGIYGGPGSYDAHVCLPHGTVHVGFEKRALDPSGEVAHILGIPVMREQPGEEADGPLGEPGPCPEAERRSLRDPCSCCGAGPSALCRGYALSSIATLPNGAIVPRGSVDGDPSVVGEPPPSVVAFTLLKVAAARFGVTGDDAPTLARNVASWLRRLADEMRDDDGFETAYERTAAWYAEGCPLPSGWLPAHRTTFAYRDFIAAGLPGWKPSKEGAG
jgi:hypothetical protein